MGSKTETTKQTIEERIEEERRQKRADLRELGVDVYPTRFDRTHTVSNAFAQFQSLSADELTALVAPGDVSLSTNPRLVVGEHENRK